MEFIVSVLVIVLTISVIAFLQVAKNERRKSKRTFKLSERDFLYTYKHILQGVLQIENDLQNIAIPLDRYAQQSHAYFSAIEILHIKQDINNQIKELLKKYNQGLINDRAAHAQLNDLSKRLHVLFFSMAA